MCGLSLEEQVDICLAGVCVCMCVYRHACTQWSSPIEQHVQRLGGVKNKMYLRNHMVSCAIGSIMCTWS